MPSQNVTSGMPPYQWQEHIGKPEAALYGAILYIFAFFAIAGNIIVCITILKVKYLNMAAGHLIISLAIADILTGFCIMSVQATSLVLRTWNIANDILCQTVGFVKIVTICTSLSSLMIISVDRYLCIIYNMSYARRVRRKWIAAILIWLCASLWASCPFYGWGKYARPPNKSICTVNWLADISYAIVLFTIYGFAPLGVMFFSYAGIAWKVRKSRIRVHNSSNYTKDERSQHESPLAQGSRCVASHVVESGAGCANSHVGVHGKVKVEGIPKPSIGRSDNGASDSISRGPVGDSGVGVHDNVGVDAVPIISRRGNGTNTDSTGINDNVGVRRSGNGSSTSGGISRDEMKVVKTMVVIITSMVICLSPYVLAEIVSIGTGQYLSPRLELYITMILYLNSCLNPWIYGGTNRRFRLAVKSRFQNFCNRSRIFYIHA